VYLQDAVQPTAPAGRLGAQDAEQVFRHCFKRNAREKEKERERGLPRDAKNTPPHINAVHFFAQENPYFYSQLIFIDL